VLGGDLVLHWSDLFGIFGVLLYVGSYFALQAGLIGGRGYLYPALNAAAAGSVLLSLLHNFNMSSAMIQITFIAISLFGMARFYIVTHRVQFSDEEQVVQHMLVPTLDKSDARRFLKLRTFRDLEEGSILTEEKSSVPCLYVIVSGLASVVVNGRQIASLGDGTLVGEMSSLSGAPASATVVTSAPSRIFEIESTVLNAYLAKNMNVRQELQSRFAGQISDKLVAANQALAGQAGNDSIPLT
jgi:hypothetical protein